MTPPANVSEQPPDVGDIVEYGTTAYDGGPRRYRVTAWLRPVVPTATLTGYDLLMAGAMLQDLDPDQICEAVLHDLLSTEDPRGIPLEWCLRDQATHVSLTGVGSTVAPVEKCRVTGRFEGPARHLADMVESAQRLARGGLPSGVFVKP